MAPTARDVEDLLLEHFDGPGLHRFLRRTYGPELTQQLPGENAPLQQIAHAAANVLERNGLINADFVAELVEELPPESFHQSSPIWKSAVVDAWCRGMDQKGDLRYMVYLSRTKLDMLYAQTPLPHTDPPQGDMAKLRTVDNYITSAKRGSVEEGRPWIDGVSQMRWGRFMARDDYRTLVYFVGANIVLIGSPQSLVGIPEMSPGTLPDYCKGFFAAIKEVLNHPPGLVLGAESSDFAKGVEALRQGFDSPAVHLEYLARRIGSVGGFVLATPLFVAMADNVPGPAT